MVSERPIYTREEAAALRDAASEGGVPRCPRCDEELRACEIPPRAEVSYVRRRVWWVCDSCGRSIVLDAVR